MDEHVWELGGEDHRNDFNSAGKAWTVESALCTLCRSAINKYYNKVNSIGTPIETAQSIDYRLSRGCHLCALIWQSLGVDESQFQMQNPQSYIETSYTKNEDLGILSIVFYEVKSVRPGMSSSKSILHRSFDLIPVAQWMNDQGIDKEAQSSISPAATTTMLWNLLGTWLQQCSNHAICTSVGQEGFLPHRLINIGQGSSDKPKLQLCHDIEPQTRYLTLSHCWGQKLLGRLLRDNLVSLLQGIPPNFLSKTFQDAIAITRRLGFTYLWIDSLCIIQDCTTDWLVESALMGKVYGNSFLTIAAAAASDGSEGLFLDRPAYTPLRINLVQGELKKPFTLHMSSLWAEFVDRSPLAMRAWVFQERILSPRILYFGKAQIFWECGKLSACEEWPTGIPQRIDAHPQEYRAYDTKADLKQEVSRLAQECSSTRSIEEVLALWEQLVHRYTQTNLTYPTDRLVAIGGVASQLYSQIPGRYLAGLWEYCFIPQLLWSTRTLDSANSSYNSARIGTRDYLTPSWSWASLNAPVETSKVINSRYPTVLYLLHLVEVHIELKSPQNLFGQVIGGHIRVQGSLAMARLSKTSPGSERWLNIAVSDEDASIGAKAVNRAIQCAWDFEFPSCVDRDNVGNDHDSDENVWYLLLVGKCEQIVHTGLSLRSFYAEGLILGRSGKGSGTFQRHGFFGDPRSGCTFDLFEDGAHYFSTTREAQRIERCANTSGGYDYTITII